MPWLEVNNVWGRRQVAGNSPGLSRIADRTCDLFSTVMKHAGLMHQFAEARMAQCEYEGKPPIAVINMADGQRARGKQMRQSPKKGN